MNRVSAQQLRSLELRIARLEKEAGVVETVSNFFKKVKNIPINLINQIGDALNDLGDTVLRPLNAKSIDAVKERLEFALERRIRGVVNRGSFNLGEPLEMVSFVHTNPLKSTFVGGSVKRATSLDKIVSLSEGEDKERLKYAYLSWKSDYGHILKEILDIENGKVNKRRGSEDFLKVLSRTSKTLYRLFRALLNLAPVAIAPVLLTSNWGSFIALFKLLFIHGDTLSQISADAANVGHSSPFAPVLPAAYVGVASLASGLLNLIEKAFYRYGVNVDAFDAESVGKTASSHPRVASVVRLLESHA
jgi:hypothetical protein